MRTRERRQAWGRNKARKPGAWAAEPRFLEEDRHSSKVLRAPLGEGTDGNGDSWSAEVGGGPLRRDYSSPASRH